jgi:hypothetical protein
MLAEQKQTPDTCPHFFVFVLNPRYSFFRSCNLTTVNFSKTQIYFINPFILINNLKVICLLKYSAQKVVVNYIMLSAAVLKHVTEVSVGCRCTVCLPPKWNQ